jgi:hypothetical protein
MTAFVVAYLIVSLALTAYIGRLGLRQRRLLLALGASKQHRGL